jgi:aryl-alcohol dehydrogenase-like predicted oxidoreductase
MDKRKLGKTGPSVSALGFGCMSIGIADIYTSSVRNDDAAIALIQRALDLGITLLDTADIYGDSERQVGKAIKGRRDDVVLATKFGFLANPADGKQTISVILNTCPLPAMPRCNDSMSITSTSTICTGLIQKYQSKKPLAQWPTW